MFADIFKDNEPGDIGTELFLYKLIIIIIISFISGNVAHRTQKKIDLKNLFNRPLSIWKSGGTNFFSLAPLAYPVLYPHLKIRGAAPD